MGTPTGLGAHFFWFFTALLGFAQDALTQLTDPPSPCFRPLHRLRIPSIDQRLNARALQATSPIWLRKNFYKNRALKRISFRKILNYAQMHFFLDP